MSNLTTMARTIPMESIIAFARNSTCASELFLGLKNDPSNVTELCSQLAQCPGFCETTFETGNSVSVSTMSIFCY
jgi:hypothetical protein